MSTQRKLIRTAVANAILGNTDAGQNVYASRVRQTWANKLPEICVYTLSEDVTKFNEAPRELKRVISLVIEIKARADAALDDALDGLAQQVETICSELAAQSKPVGGTASDLILVSVGMHLNGEGDNQYGSCILTYDCTYYEEDVATGTDTRFGNLLAPFVTAHTDFASPQTGETLSTDDTTLTQ